MGTTTLSSGNRNILTWDEKPTASEFGVGQAWFMDIADMGYSDGEAWNIPALSESINVKSFGAAGNFNKTTWTGTDDTPAFLAAFAEANILRGTSGNNYDSKRTVYVPPGHYLLDELRIPTAIKLIGSGYDNTFFYQKSTDKPILKIRPWESSADGDVYYLGWHIKDVVISGITLRGIDDATVPSVTCYASGEHVMFNCKLDYFAENTYQALNILPTVSDRVYRNEFIVNSNISTVEAVFQGSGSYNSFDIFAVLCGTETAVDLTGTSGVYRRLITDGQIKLGGYNNTILGATVEEWANNVTADNAAIWDKGVNNTWVSPTVTTNVANSATFTYGFKGGNNTTFINPKIWGLGQIPSPFKPTNSTYQYTVIGGSSNALNTVETDWVDEADSSSIQNISFVGDCSDFTDGHRDKNQQVTQIDVTDQVVRTKNNTDVLLLEPTYTVGTRYIYLPKPYDNRVFTVRSIRNMDVITWYAYAGEDIASLPNNMTANESIILVYKASPAKWHVLSGYNDYAYYATSASTYTITTKDIYVYFNAGCTITLPNPASFKYRVLTFRTTTAAAIISASSNVNIDGAVGTAILPATAGKWAKLQSNGTSWQMIENN